MQRDKFYATPSSDAVRRYLRWRSRQSPTKLARALGYLCLLFYLIYSVLFFQFFDLTPDVTLSLLQTRRKLLLLISCTGATLGIVAMGVSLVQYFKRRRYTLASHNRMLTSSLIAGFSCCLSSAILFLTLLILWIAR
jgi:hypothetical protein